jgi:integrase
VLALTWRDVDLDLGTISVARSLYRAKGGRSIFNDPKSAKGRRLVSLTPSTTIMLRSLRERQETDGLIQGYMVNEDSPVFRYRVGSPILPRGYSGAFIKIMRRAKLEGYRLHDARHAHATLMLKQGVHPKIVQERLGHAKVSTTLDIYSHVTPGLQEAAALRFEEGLMNTRQPERIAEPV